MAIEMRMLLDQGVFKCRISFVKSVKNDSPFPPKNNNDENILKVQFR